MEPVFLLNGTHLCMVVLATLGTALRTPLCAQNQANKRRVQKKCDLLSLWAAAGLLYSTRSARCPVLCIHSQHTDESFDWLCARLSLGHISCFYISVHCSATCIVKTYKTTHNRLRDQRKWLKGDEAAAAIKYTTMDINFLLLHASFFLTFVYNFFCKSLVLRFSFVFWPSKQNLTKLIWMVIMYYYFRNAVIYRYGKLSFWCCNCPCHPQAK